MFRHAGAEKQFKINEAHSTAVQQLKIKFSLLSMLMVLINHTYLIFMPMCKIHAYRNKLYTVLIHNINTRLYFPMLSLQRFYSSQGA